MDSSLLKTQAKRKKRQMRVRKKVRGTTLRPRLSVFKSNRNISVQIINDDNGLTLCSYGTLNKDFKLPKEVSPKSIEAAKMIGTKIAELASSKNITNVVFDRGRYKYHGIVASVADAAREKGLQF